MIQTLPFCLAITAAFCSAAPAQHRLLYPADSPLNLTLSASAVRYVEQRKPDVLKAVVEYRVRDEVSRMLEDLVFVQPNGTVGQFARSDAPHSAGLVRWHSDHAAALAAAANSGKPVLLFQLLGRLDQEFC